MLKSLFAGVAATLVAGAAVAADLPRRSGAVAPAPYFAAKPFTWTGAYAGVNAGYGFGKFTKAARSTVGDADGVTLGATAGYNHQIQNVVLGAEADLGWAQIDGKTGASQGKINALGTVRARAGYAADRALVYATAGYAGGNAKMSQTGASESKWLNGYAVGGGIEYAFTDKITAKGEYLYHSLSSKSYFATGTTAAGAHVSTVRTGVNYKF